MHWVGDLIMEADVEPADDSSGLMLHLVEAGVKYRCEFDLSTGVATLSIDDNGQPRRFDAAEGESGQPTAETSVVAGRQSEIRFSNWSFCQVSLGMSSGGSFSFWPETMRSKSAVKTW